jgi:hypothetical protein
MAAAAMTPRSFETAFNPFSFPGVNFISSSVNLVQRDVAPEQASVRQFLAVKNTHVVRSKVAESVVGRSERCPHHPLLRVIIQEKSCLSYQ